MRGRKPTPTALKRLAGNPGKRRLPKDEPTPRKAVPRPPAHLSKEAKTEWQRVIKELETLGLVTLLDRAALAAYCQAYGRWVRAEKALAEKGEIVKSPSGYPIQNPFLAIANKAWDQMMRVLPEFGMTPSARTRVKAEKDEQPQDPLIALLARRGASPN